MFLKHVALFCSGTAGAWRLCGYSRDGHILSNYKLHMWDPDQYGDGEDVEQAVDEYVKYIVYMIELMIGQMKPLPVSQQFVVLFDLSGFRVSLAFRSNVRLMIRKLIYVAQAQYPERLHKALLINAPFGFETAWRLICPLLDEKTAAKITFCSSSKITEVVSPEVLCVDYGGTHPEYPVPAKCLEDEIRILQEEEQVKS